jgi:hypothetical protein
LFIILIGNFVLFRSPANIYCFVNFKMHCDSVTCLLREHFIYVYNAIGNSMISEDIWDRVCLEFVSPDALYNRPTESVSVGFTILSLSTIIRTWRAFRHPSHFKMVTTTWCLRQSASLDEEMILGVFQIEITFSTLTNQYTHPLLQ